MALFCAIDVNYSLQIGLFWWLFGVFSRFFASFFVFFGVFACFLARFPADLPREMAALTPDLTPPDLGGSARFSMNYELRTTNNRRLSSDKLAGILTYQRTKVNIKVSKNGKNLAFVVFGHPEPIRLRSG